KSCDVDDPDSKVNDKEEYCHSEPFLSIQKITELMNDIFDTASGSACVQDVGVSNAMDVDQPSLVNNVLGDVHVDSVVKDGDETGVKTVVVPFQRKKKLKKACLSPYVVQQLTTEIKCKKRRRNNNNKKYKKVIRSVFGPDGNEIPLLPRKEDLTRPQNAQKDTVSVPEEIMSLFRDKKKMEMQWTFPWPKDDHVVQMKFWENLVGRSHSKRGWLSNDVSIFD
ncbi:hypothetical protein Tco_1349618, partial [Tanacetum coccineum]